MEKEPTHPFIIVGAMMFAGVTIFSTLCLIVCCGIPTYLSWRSGEPYEEEQAYFDANRSAFNALAELARTSNNVTHENDGCLSLQLPPDYQKWAARVSLFMCRNPKGETLMA